MQLFDVSPLLPYADQFAAGMVTTVLLSAITVAVSFALSIVGVAARIAPVRVIRGCAAAYVHLFRNTPLLVLLYGVFYGLGASGFRIEAMVAAAVALIVNSTAYTIEIYRGGIAGIPAVQREAGAALGFSPLQVSRFIILPQAFRIAFYPLGNQVVSIVLGSALVMVIGTPDLTYVSFNVGASTYQYLQTFVLAAMVYFVTVQLINGVWRAAGRALMPAQAKAA